MAQKRFANAIRLRLVLVAVSLILGGEKEMSFLKRIKFSHDYYKLPRDWEGTEAVLLGVNLIIDVDNLPVAFIAYDTKFRNEEGMYKLFHGSGLLLLFWHLNTCNLFTTIRRYTLQKSRYYNGSIGETFILEMIKP
jgi:hypothetical protein